MNIDKLRELHINNNSLNNINATNLLGNPPDHSKIIPLTILNAAHNTIGSIDSAVMKSMTNLKKLNLGTNQLASFPLDSLVRSTSLEYVNLESNKIETLSDWGVMGRNGLKIDVTGTT